MLAFRYLCSYEKNPPGTNLKIPKYFIFEEDSFLKEIMVNPKLFCL